MKQKRRNYTDTTETQWIVRNYYEELYAKKCENLDEMDTYLKNITFQNSMKKKQKREQTNNT